MLLVVKFGTEQRVYKTNLTRSRIAALRLALPFLTGEHVVGHAELEEGDFQQLPDLLLIAAQRLGTCLTAPTVAPLQPEVCEALNELFDSYESDQFVRKFLKLIEVSRILKTTPAPDGVQ
jgi:hypothetical protein